MKIKKEVKNLILSMAREKDETGKNVHTYDQIRDALTDKGEVYPGTGKRFSTSQLSYIILGEDPNLARKNYSKSRTRAVNRQMDLPLAPNALPQPGSHVRGLDKLYRERAIIWLAKSRMAEKDILIDIIRTGEVDG